MTQGTLYEEVRRLLWPQLNEQLSNSTLERVVLLVTGMVASGSSGPSQIAGALAKLKLSEASAESIERRVRRIENDREVNTTLCFHPFARHHLLLGKAKALVLSLDPTTQDERVVLLTVAVRYRGCALPLAWAVWPGNQPLREANFWQRVELVLAEVKTLLPAGVEVTITGDRAFGTPAFCDLVTAQGWHYVVRIQRQTRYQDHAGGEHCVAELVSAPNQRRKLVAKAFKKYQWRTVTLVAYWGARHKEALLLASDLKPAWALIQLYQRRSAIEAFFRDLKSDGWHWEQSQVVDLAHLQRLLVGLALATWMTLLAGTAVAQTLLSRPPTGQRRTRPYDAKFSLFALGRQHLTAPLLPGLALTWRLTGWLWQNWSAQLTALHRKAFVFSC